MPNAEYFRTGLADDLKKLHDDPPTVQIVLDEGRFNVYQILSIAAASVSLLIYPQDGSPLPENTEADRRSGSPRHRAECIVVPYSAIKSVRLSLQTQRKQPFGFSA